MLLNMHENIKDAVRYIDDVYIKGDNELWKPDRLAGFMYCYRADGTLYDVVDPKLTVRGLIARGNRKWAAYREARSDEYEEMRALQRAQDRKDRPFRRDEERRKRLESIEIYGTLPSRLK